MTRLKALIGPTHHVLPGIPGSVIAHGGAWFGSWVGNNRHLLRPSAALWGWSKLCNNTATIAAASAILNETMRAHWLHLEAAFYLECAFHQRRGLTSSWLIRLGRVA